MPDFKVIVRGGLAMTGDLSKKLPPGSTVQLTAESAASLPPGTVEPVKTEKKSEDTKPAPTKKEASK